MQNPALPPYIQQNKGTLVPGQTISVNKYTVQVERYLSQGGFSHVYLVRTATPVHCTTHHVLKRIGVPNEAMLTEVKMEVDIMRILKGHPNVVYLIDAAWHRMSNGQYEVFILMEFCPGGGIIDMMNRRLRERLTETEILQIFVDVCEGVAAMHNLRPALLHRDLKVENILQSSSTSFKLCDFGSATPVAPRPPSTAQEIRVLEADLNRHTTLQYRAPEMVDLYLRRPVDEKSDVWALGVLLYKLCYYTTPFEEHGPLAILNVQYRIPPYPVYSSQLNTMIASMLREHGTQRPSVFELLTQAHRMRGTKSRFVYTIEPPQPLSPRSIQPSSTTIRDLVSYRPSSSNAGQRTSSSQPKDTLAPLQGSDKVVEALVPVSRGRQPPQQPLPVHSATSRPPSPPKVVSQPTPRNGKLGVLGDSFGAEEEKSWKALKSSVPNTRHVRAHKSGSAATSAWRPKGAAPGVDNAWSSESLTSKVAAGDAQTSGATFGDNFAEKLWNAYDGMKTGSGVTLPPEPTEQMTPSKIAPPPEGSRNTKLVITKGRDAFDGLGLATPVPPAPTLGEARKLRTGLAALSGHDRTAITPSPGLTNAKHSSSSTRPTPSPRPTPPPINSSWRSNPSAMSLSESIPSNPPVLPQVGELSVETRFPSLEELDATFGSSKTLPSTAQPEASKGKPKDLSTLTANSSPLLRSTPQRSVASSSFGQSNVRSELLTGLAMPDTKEFVIPNNGDNYSTARHTNSRPTSRPSLSRKHGSSASFKPSPLQLPHEPTTQRIQEPKDWLTGDLDTLLLSVKDRNHVKSPETPVLREFTNKRSSFVEENNIRIQSPQEAISDQQSPRQQPSRAPTPTKRPSRRSRSKSKERRQHTGATDHVKEAVFPSRSFTSELPARPVDLNSSAAGVTRRSSEKFSDQWKPSSAFGSPLESKMSSSDDESPEDAVRFMPSAEKGSTRRRKGRQSSVHDLVDLWGGGVVQTKERKKDSVPSAVIDTSKDLGAKLQKHRSITVPSHMKTGTSSTQRLQIQALGAIEVPRSPSRSPDRRSPSHVKQVSAIVSSTSASTGPTPPSQARPQSLLVFPVSKSISDGKLDTPTTPSGLSVPQDGSRKDGSRRTSITDMVQKYEANLKGAGAGPPLIAPKPAGLKLAGKDRLPAPAGRSPVQAPLNTLTVSKCIQSQPSGHTSEDNPGANLDKRQAPIGLRKPSITSQGEKADKSRSQGSAAGIPSGTSNRVLASGASQGRIDGLPSVPMPLALKATLPSEEGPRSPSPDKPYRGVGKLIDQWQKKSEGEMAHGPAPRRSFVVKRAGLVSNDISQDS
ncbi:hypothetical protein F5I97DRAFT_1189889 [Phlebopus sp. FC_14]|nr:hypothetical protein F5I97DRAFT_1189889 [Phlebopus sp. FC_14]